MDHVCVRRSQRHKRKPLRYQAIEKVTKIPQKRFHKTKSTNIKCMYNEIIYKLRYLQKVIKLKNQETEKKNKIGIGEMVPVYFKSLNKQTNMLYKMVKQLKIMLILREYEQRKEQEQQQKQEQQQQEQEQEQEQGQGQEQKQEKEQQKEEQTTITV